MKRYWLFIKKLFSPIMTIWRRQSGGRKGFIILLVIGCGIYWMLANPIYHASNDGTPTKVDGPELKSKTGDLTKGTPEYKTYLPAGKTIENFGGWTRVSPPDRNPVYAYSDTLFSTPINVSQQPLPKEFQPDIATQVAELAKGYHADHFISVKDTKVYIGTSAKGPQSVIFVKGETLVLIKSSAKLTDDQWTSYVDSLR